MLLNYEKCTPKKTEEPKQYNGSPMEVEFFENRVVANSDTSKNEFLAETKTESKRKKNTSRAGSRKSTKQVDNKDFNKKKERISCQTKIGIVITTVVLSVLFHFLLYQHATSDTSCDCEVNIEHLHKNLLEEVYNQTGCIDSMISSLYNRSRWPKKKKVLVYTGGVGVGKTFIINIAKRHFPREGILEIVHIDQKIGNFDPNICCNLVIIDNLNAANVDNVITLLNFLPDTTYSLVVIVFNAQKTDRDFNYFYDHEAINAIDREFAASSLYFESCNFNTLGKRTALIWLKKEFAKRRINETLQKNITDYILANSNFTQSGFKRLSQKLAIAAEIFNID